ncbi:MAG: hypothetical protein LBO05_11550 [Deltaproteobacteria bacterium]|nr:hypothetical protein [Deltaproteobacteria bacterium]
MDVRQIPLTAGKLYGIFYGTDSREGGGAAKALKGLEIKNLKPPAKPQKLYDGNGLFPYLKELQHRTGNGRNLFPSMRIGDRHISDMTLLAGLRRLDISKEEMTVHGFRSMASTLLNEKGYDRDWIERQLAHSEGDIRGACNYAQYKSERTKMMQDRADYLDTLR